MKRHFACALLLALAIFAAGCARTTTTSLPAAVDQHLAWVPQNVNGVAYCDLQSVRQSELGQALEKDFSERIERFRADEDYKEFLEKTGFDVEKDLHSVLLGFQGTHDEDSHNFAVIATGNFDEQKIVQAARDSMGYHHKRHEMATETYNGKTIYVIKEHGEKACYFADAHTLVAGGKEWIQTIIDGKTADQSVKQNKAVTALMGKLRYKDQCWFVANTSEVMKKVAEELGEKGNFKGTRAVKAVEGITFSANVGKKAELYGEALCDSEDNSKLLMDAAKGALATAKLAVSDDRDAVDMLNRFDIDLAGKSVKMSASLDKAFFDKMREKAEQHGKAVALF